MTESDLRDIVGGRAIGVSMPLKVRELADDFYVVVNQAGLRVASLHPSSTFKRCGDDWCKKLKGDGWVMSFVGPRLSGLETCEVFYKRELPSIERCLYQLTRPLPKQVAEDFKRM